MIINLAIYLSSKNHIYEAEELNEMPHYEYGLLLGTSDRLRGGLPNPHFWHRIEAAATLYHAGKIDFIIASGDPRPGRQNEVIAMQKALLAKNIPQDKIILDPQGVRTFASIQGAKERFKLKKFLIISQRYHNYRAVYIARALGLEARAYAAPKVPFNASFKTEIREIAARVKAVIDIFNYSIKS